MSTLRSLILLGVTLTTLLACKPEDQEEQPPTPVAAAGAGEVFARQICAGLFACSCSGATTYESEGLCVEELSGELQADIDALVDAGATWNDDCAGQLVDTWADRACLGSEAASLDHPFDARLCPVVKGVLAVGDPCTRSSIGDDCSPGLSCYSGVCVETSVPVPVGGACQTDWEQLPCEAGSYCDYDETSNGQICKPLPVAGDPCNPNENYQCGPSSRDLVCGLESMVCEPAPGVGEPCYEYGLVCGPGNYCDGGKDFTCQAQFELGDGCGADAVCPIDASCVANVCEPNPAAACNIAYNNLL